MSSPQAPLLVVAYRQHVCRGGGDGDHLFQWCCLRHGRNDHQGGQGNDTIVVILSGNSDLSATQILGGGGDDVFSGNGQNLHLNTALSNTIAGGGGSDTINVKFQATATSNYILGDALNTLGEYDGADQIVLGVTTNFSSNTFRLVAVTTPWPCPVRRVDQPVPDAGW